MGTPAAAAAVALAVLAAPGAARADAVCTGTTAAGATYDTCFDPGNRLYLSATTDGYGGGLRLRHTVTFDDEPDLTWKLEHRIAEAAGGGLSGRYGGAVYQGRYLRHARDGHLVLPLGIPRKIFLPFDVGAEASAGTVRGWIGDPMVELGVVDVAALIDLSRSAGFRRRFALGLAARWEVDLDRRSLDAARHRVAPFTVGVVDLGLESADGLTNLGLRVSGGAAWTTDDAWAATVRGRASVERIVLALNDRPVALFVGAGYHDPGELRGEVGVRVTVLGRRDPRVAR